MRVEPLLLTLAAGCAAGDPADAMGYCPSAVVLNEVMAAGDVDWIELHNRSNVDVDLLGYGLSRADWTVQFEFDEAVPDSLLGAGGYLTLTADTFPSDDGSATTGFDLNRDGDVVYLLAPERYRWAECDSVGYPDQHQDVSWARIADGDHWDYAAKPTRNGPNSTTTFPTE